MTITISVRPDASVRRFPDVPGLVAEASFAAQGEGAGSFQDTVRFPLDAGLLGQATLPDLVADGPVILRLLQADGSARLTRPLAAAAGKPLVVTLSRAEVAGLQDDAPPAVPAPRMVTRTARLFPTGPGAGSIPAGEVLVAPFDTATWAALGLKRLFKRDDPASTAIEWLDAWPEQAQLAWRPVHLAVDGTFSASFPAVGDGWLWWMNGRRRVVGAVVGDDLTVDSRPTLGLVLPPLAPMPFPQAVASVPAVASEREIADNPAVFSEDPGSVCRPFSNPERVLSERSFYSILRVEQPEIGAQGSSGLVSESLLEEPAPAPAPAHAPGPVSVPGGAAAGGGITSLAGRLVSTLPGLHRVPEAYGQALRQMDRGRTGMDGGKPAQWEGPISRYQATTVARGHILEHRVRWRSNGYSLGTVAKTLSLAPRQTTRIQKVEWARSERARRAERTEFSESIQDGTDQSRDYDDTVSATLNEWSLGTSHSDTEAVAGGVGFAAPGVVGGAGGGAGSANSRAEQDSSRAATVSEEQRLRDSVRRFGDSLRRLESVVVNEVQQEETVTGTSELIRNHNYAHSLTVIYYQILRHLRVETVFAGVRECLFVPFAILPFTVGRAYRWREAIRRSLRSSEYRPAMALLRDVATGFAGSDILAGRRCDQPVRHVHGHIMVKLAIGRPADKEDGRFDHETWSVLHGLLGTPARAIHARLSILPEQLRDEVFQAEYAGDIAERWVERFTIAGAQPHPARVKLSSRYRFGAVARVDFTFEAPLTGDRAGLETVTVEAHGKLPPESFALVTGLHLTYRTDRFEHTAMSPWGMTPLISERTGHVVPGGARRDLPLDQWELVDLRREAAHRVRDLVDHLNEHVEFYHKAIWWRMDRNRLTMLLDGFYVPGSHGLSVASVVEHAPLAVVGNALVFRVSAGVFLGLGAIDSRAKLHALYASDQQPRDPMHVSLPTDGLYAQTVMDECLALEEHFGNHDWVLQDTAPDVGPLDASLLATRRSEASAGSGNPTPAPATIINLQNAPEPPAPSGFAGVLGTVGRGDAFRDLTGLAGTQANAIAGLQAAAGLATGFGTQAAALAAADLASQAQATNTADQKLASIKRAQAGGLIDPAEATRQATQVLQATHQSSVPLRPHQEPSLQQVIQAAGRTPGSVIEATTSDGQVKVALGRAAEGGTRDLTIGRNQPWMFEGSLLLGDFEVAKADLRPAHEAALMDLVEFAAERTSEGGRLLIRGITGHASPTGPEDARRGSFAGNRAISVERATAVMEFLRDNGIRVTELPQAVEARGSLDPVVETLPGVEHAMNRSVEVQIQIADFARAVREEPGFRLWQIGLSAAMGNLAKEMKTLADGPGKKTSLGLKVGAKLDLGTLACLEPQGPGSREIVVYNFYGGLGVGLDLSVSRVDELPDRLTGIVGGTLGKELLDARAWDERVKAVLGLLNVAVSPKDFLPDSGKFYTYKPVNFDWFQNRPVIMLQTELVAMGGIAATVLAFLDTDAPKSIGAITFMAGFLLSPLSVDASSTVHFGAVYVRD